MNKAILTACSILLVFASHSILAGEQELLYSYKPLPPGAVRPEGWLLDWAKAAAGGITGDLDTRTAVFEKGWTGEDFKGVGVKPHGMGWPVEQCAYWLDGLVRLAYILDDETLIQKAKSRLDPVVEGINKSKGDSMIHWMPKSALDDYFNNWGCSHMGRALVAYYQATGDKRILHALVKVYRNFPLPDMNKVPFHRVSGAVNLDPMIDTYLMSGDPQILKNIQAFADRKATADLVDNWLNDKELDGHNVIFYENARVPALLYQVTGDKRMFDATGRLLDSKYEKHGLPMGLTSGEEYHSGIGSTRYVETCNVACGGWTYYWLLRIAGKAQYADRMEDILFNAGPVPFSRDCKLLAYYQVPNRTANIEKPADGVLPGELPRYCTHTYSALGGTLCCVGNCNRIIPNYIEHMWMTARDGSPVAMVYGPCTLNTTVKGVPLQIRTETEYPFEESITMKVSPEKETDFAVGLRMPGWCASPKVSINGQAVAISPDKQGFVWLKRKWSLADTIRLTFPMQTKVVMGHETPFPVIPRRKEANYHHRRLATRSDISSPFAYVTYGPLLFALPIAEKTLNEPAADAQWNYALDVAPDEAQSHIKVVRRKMKSPWNWTLDAPIKLVVDARQFDWSPTQMQPMPAKPVTDGKEAKITLVPYNCTKFHITMFPITDRVEGKK
ncbi:MAG: glycoside hydrolase family 127 protein [Pirellulales bacterium]|nr:glycoside hydrolase family 127 protein [Pirellulales bacterium]